MKRLIINQKDFDGDITFFDNRYCYTSGNPHYERISMFPESNEIVATRLIDYQSPDRTDYIYLKRTSDDDCYFEVSLTLPEIAHGDDYHHKYFKVEGDFKADLLQDIQFLVRDSQTAEKNIDAEIRITPDAAVIGADVKALNAAKQGEWFHLLWAIDINEHKADVYIGGKKIICNMSLSKDIKQLNSFILSLNGSSVLGDLYVDNFNVTGLVKPIVDGVETKTGVIPTDDNIIDFLSDKIGMHAYGNTLHKDGVKTELKTKGIYDKNTEQYYVTVDILNKAFDLDLTDEKSEITGDITIKADGTVTLKDGTSFNLEYKPKIQNGNMYVPIRQLAQDALGKHVWWFKTGILLFAEYEISLDTTDWEYQSKRVNSQCTIWNDIDYLNAYLQYVRPDEKKLKEDYIAKMDDNTLSKHPRLYFTAEDFIRLKEKYESKADLMFTNWINNFIKEADGYIDTDSMVTYTYQDKMRQFNCVSKALGDRFKAWGIAYHMTGEQKYVDAAFKQFKIAKTFPDFNTAHIIDTGEAAHSLAIGYDWFYNAFTTEQRELALKVVRQKCLDVLASGFYGRITSSSDGAIEWRSFKWMSNYNAIVNTGVIAAAIATLECDPDVTFRYIKDSLRSIEYTMQMFTPGGSWNEGPNYWDFTMRYLVAFAFGMEKNFGQSYNIMDGQGMAETLQFITACLGTAGTNNMGDSNMDTTFSYDSFFYLAKRYNNPVPAVMRFDDLKSKTAKATFYDLVFYDANKMCDKSVLESMPKMQRVDGMEVFSIRDSYARKDSDMYFSAHFGTTSGYHQHYDCGTFVFDLFGKRWAYDLGSDSYLLQNELGYPVYAIFRKRAEAHNMLVINPAAYKDRIETENGNFAPIIDAKANNSGGFAYADLSNVYEDAPNMTLGYYIDDNLRSVTMRNEFTLKTARNCIWTMNTKGKIKIDGNTAYITQDDDTIRLEVICTGESIKWQDNGNPRPLPTSPQCPEQNKNEDFTQLRLVFNAPKGENKLIIKISPDNKKIKPIEDVQFSQWKLI